MNHQGYESVYKNNSFNGILPPCKGNPGWICSMDFKKWLVKIFIVNDSMTSVDLTQETDKCKGIATSPVGQNSPY